MIGVAFFCKFITSFLCGISIYSVPLHKVKVGVAIQGACIQLSDLLGNEIDNPLKSKKTVEAFCTCLHTFGGENWQKFINKKLKKNDTHVATITFIFKYNP